MMSVEPHFRSVDMNNDAFTCFCQMLGKGGKKLIKKSVANTQQMEPFPRMRSELAPGAAKSD